MELEFHRELIKTITNFAAKNAWTVYTEVLLPNNKRADILLTNSTGAIRIIEVKTTLHNYHYRETVKKYQQYCDALYIAAPHTDCISKPMYTTLIDIMEAVPLPGLLTIHGNEVMTLKEPLSHSLQSSDRALVQAVLARRTPAAKPQFIS